MNTDLNIAILIPCYNEAIAISDVVNQFKKILPTSAIYVYDNNSTDNTADIAKSVCALVREEKNKGKGNVVRRMFADIEADIYLLIDGDNTYDINQAPDLINALITEQCDMVVGNRVEVIQDNKYKIYRPGHRLGNAFFGTVI